MKKFAFIFGIVLLAAILVCAGYWLGFEKRFMSVALSDSMLDRALSDAIERVVVLDELDSGHVANAGRFLRLEQNNDILEIWSLGDYSDPRNQRLATNLLARIAAHRTEYPAIYTNHSSGDEMEIDSKIVSILLQAKQQQAK